MHSLRRITLYPIKRVSKRFLYLVMTTSCLIFYFLQREASKRDFKVTGAISMKLYSKPRDASYNFSTVDLSRKSEDEIKNTLSSFTASASFVKEKLKVYVVPHSHLDPGWIRTFKNYTETTNAIMNSALEFMANHPDMTFQWAEVSFLDAWWANAAEEKKDVLRKLVDLRQFDLLTGAWTMTDEAVPHFWASIDNLIEGHRFLNKEFGLIPNVSWSCDPFGYGPTMPFLLRKTGLNKLVISRIHTITKDYLRASKNLEFSWRQTWDSGGDFDTKVHALAYKHYDTPASCGTSLDVCCQFDFKRLTGDINQCRSRSRIETISKANVKQKAQLLLREMQTMASHYKHNRALFLVGDDFRYSTPQEWAAQYDNYRAIMDYVNGVTPEGHNNELNAEMKFSTISQFFEDLPEEVWAPTNSPKLVGDFFPYCDNGQDYWTGYYTSRPIVKRLDRIVQARLRAADLFSNLALASVARSGESVSGVSGEFFEKLTAARREVALIQHHDAITGTSRAVVMEDYRRRLVDALGKTNEVISKGSEILTGSTSGNTQLLEEPGETVAPISDPINISVGQTKFIKVMNPLLSDRIEILRLRVNETRVKVTRGDGQSIKTQIQPAIHLGLRNKVEKLYELLIPLELSPASITNIQLTGIESQPESTVLVSWHAKGGPAANPGTPFSVKMLDEKYISLAAPHFTAVINSNTGLLKAISDGSVSSKLAISFIAYASRGGGAYIFRDGPVQEISTNATAINVLQGPVMSEVHTHFDGIWHRLSISKLNHGNKASTMIQVHNVVDIVAVRKKTGLDNIEVAMRTDTNVHNGHTFWTDSMGYQLLKRHKQEKKLVTQNYYPISSAIYIEDADTRLTILTAQPHGGTNHAEGGLELMLDRRAPYDDGRGMDEGVSDNKPTSSEFTLVWEDSHQKGKKMSADDTEKYDTKLTSYHSASVAWFIKTMQNPVLLLLQNSSTVSGTLADFLPPLSPLPVNLELMSLRTIDSKQGPLLMTVHRLGLTCSGCKKSYFRNEANQKVTVETFPQLLDLLNINDAVETSLTGIYDKHRVSARPFLLGDIQPMDMISYKLFREPPRGNNAN